MNKEKGPAFGGAATFMLGHMAEVYGQTEIHGCLASRSHGGTGPHIWLLSMLRTGVPNVGSRPRLHPPLHSGVEHGATRHWASPRPAPMGLSTASRLTGQSAATSSSATRRLHMEVSGCLLRAGVPNVGARPMRRPPLHSGVAHGAIRHWASPGPPARQVRDCVADHSAMYIGFAFTGGGAWCLVEQQFGSPDF